jgi:hypothetical protein
MWRATFDAGDPHIQFDLRDLETQTWTVFRHRQPKGPEIVKAEHTSAAPDLDSTAFPSKQQQRCIDDGTPATIFLVQQVPEPTVHPVLRLAAHLGNLKYVRSIVFEKPRNPDELERKGFAFPEKGGLSENQPHCRPQA